MIELYHREPVSHSARVLICLQEIGVDYQSNYVDLLDFEQFSDSFLALNSAAQVPVLGNDGVTLTESALINQYLAESFPDAGLAATNAPGWYETIIWSKYVDYNLSSSLATLGCQKYLTPLLEKRDQDTLKQAIESIPVTERRPGWRMAADGGHNNDQSSHANRKTQLAVTRMERILADADWLVGDNYSIADIDTFAMIVSLQDVASGIVNRDAAPNTFAWLNRISARPEVKAVMASGTRHEFGKVCTPGPEHSRWG